MKEYIKARLILIGLVIVVVGAVSTVVFLATNKTTPEEFFVRTVRSQVAGTSDVNARDILSLGVSVCTAEKETNIPREKIVTTFTDNGFTVREANVLIDAANEYLCDQDE